MSKYKVQVVTIVVWGGEVDKREVVKTVVESSEEMFLYVEDVNHSTVLFVRNVDRRLLAAFRNWDSAQLLGWDDVQENFDASGNVVAMVDDFLENPGSGEIRTRPRDPEGP